MTSVVVMQQHRRQQLQQQQPPHEEEEEEQQQQQLQHQHNQYRRQRIIMSNNQEKNQRRYNYNNNNNNNNNNSFYYYFYCYCCVLLSTCIGFSSTHLCLAFNNYKYNYKYNINNNNLNQRIFLQKQGRNLILERIIIQHQQSSCTHLLLSSSSSSALNDDDYLVEVSKLVPTTTVSATLTTATTTIRSTPLSTIAILQDSNSIDIKNNNYNNNNNNKQSFNKYYTNWQTFIKPISTFLIYCISMTILLISVEDILCQWVLPSRHRTELLSIVHQQQQQQSSSSSSLSLSTLSSLSSLSLWGQSTIGGLGFGKNERILLYDTSSLANDYTSTSTSTDTSTTTEHIVGYNEIMLQHRTITVPQWKETKRIITTSTTTNSNSKDQQQQQQVEQEQTKILVANAIKVIIDNYKQLKELEQYTNDYQWDTIRTIIHTSKSITNLSQAGTVLRTYIQYQLQDSSDTRGTTSKDISIIGFDWGSCAWKNQCGTIADIQESYDEIDTLLGILQPYEILFCYDIIERSIRDMLVIVPWNLAYSQDYKYYLSIPSYKSKVIIPSSNDNSNTSDNDNDYDDLSKFDQEYLRALQQLRVE